MTEKNGGGRTKLFLSYCWADQVEADTIDNDFKRLGLLLRRDTRDLQYRKSIPDFMNSISDCDYVIILISDNYLKRENCVYELSNVIDSFKEKAIPILLDNKHNVFDPGKQREALAFWQHQLDAFKGNRESPSNINKQQIRQYIDTLKKFFSAIKSMKLDSLAALQQSKYTPLLKELKLDIQTIIIRISTITDIPNLEERELEVERFLEEHPNNQFGLFQYARLADEQDRKQIAIGRYEKLIKLYPFDFMGHYNLATLLTRENQQLEKAYSYFKRAIEIDPYYNAYNNLGLLCEKLSRDNEAIDWYQKSIEIDPFSPASSNLGNLYYKNKNIEKALDCYKEGLEVNPDYATLHYNIAHIQHHVLKNYEQAKENYVNAIQKNPMLVEAHTNLAIILQDYFRDFREARLHFRIALDINPRKTEALAGLANLLHTHYEEFEEAKLLYERAINEEPNNIPAYINFALLQRSHLDDSQGAFETLTTALGHACDDSQRARIYYSIGQIKYLAGNHVDAMEYNAKAVEYAPDVADYHYNLAGSYALNGHPDKAIEHYEKCININPNEPTVYVYLATIFFEKNGVVDGLDYYYYKALSINPDYAEAHYLLAAYFIVNNEKAKAKVHFDLAIKLGLVPPDDFLGSQLEG